MKAATAIGIGLAAGAIILAGIMEGVAPPMLLNINALILVLGGTAGAVFGGVGMKRFMLIPKLYMKAIMSEQPDLGTRVKALVSFAERARKDGLLALEEEIEGDRRAVHAQGHAVDRRRHRSRPAARDPRLRDRRDGRAPQAGLLGLREGRRPGPDHRRARHRRLAGARALQLSAPETLGPAISGAFIATLYGVGSANVVYLPVCYSLQMLSQKEVDERSLVLEGILAIQAGDNPRMVQQKLLSYLAPAERDAVEAGDAKAELKAVDGGAAQAAVKPDHERARRQEEAWRRPRRPSGRALAGHLCGPDDAARGVVHGAVLDLIGEQVQAGVAPALPAGRVQRQGAAGRSVHQGVGRRHEHQTPSASPKESSLQPFVGSPKDTSVSKDRPAPRATPRSRPSRSSRSSSTRSPPSRACRARSRSRSPTRAC